MAEEVIGLLADMLSGRFHPNIVGYKIVLRLYKARRIDDAIEVLAAMIENGC